jgi:hypothetical protein
MMRNDDEFDIDLSRHRSSRIPRVVLILSTLGILLIAAWVFAPNLMPNLMTNYAAVMARLFEGPKPHPAAQEQPAAPTVASAQATPAATPAATAAAPAASEAAPPPVTTAAAATDDQASPPAAAIAPAAAAPAAVDTTSSTTWSAPPWPQNRGIQAAGPAAPPANADNMQVASVAPADTPAEPFDNVPLPRKRPSRLIAASLAVPLPRPRPEIEGDAPAEPSVFDLQVERMR